MQVPDKVTDFAGRAMHETTVVGKALTAAYYGTAPTYSYMIECGGGSAAALHEVQKYPADYNGVVVGGHAAHLTRQIFGQLWLWTATHPNGVAILPAAKLPVIHDAVLAKCDMLDGVKDGLLENPTRCTFDPKEIECRSGDGPNCLTTPQVEAVRKIYAGPTNPGRTRRSGRRSIAAASWTGVSSSTHRSPIGIATSTLRDAILKDPTWDYRTTPVDFDRDVALADRSDIARVNASNPDISAYVRQGGKLILSGGWNNALVPAGAVLDYYNSVEATIGRENTRRAVRLYMVPGMIECNGGPGTDTFDMLGVMRRWVERGQAPNEVIASRVEHGKVVRTRPLCPYPQVATYQGKGSTDDARNFACNRILALLALDRAAVDLDSTDVDVTAGAVSAAGHQVGEADGVYLGQIGMINPRPDGHDARDVELEPAKIGRRDLVLVEVGLKARRAIADQPCSIGKPHDRPRLMEAGRPDDPTDLRERRAQVHEVRAIAQRGRARRRRRAGPQVVRHEVWPRPATSWISLPDVPYSVSSRLGFATPPCDAGHAL